jgi:hypothetical protein
MRPTIQEVSMALRTYHGHQMIEKYKLNHGLFTDGYSIKLSKQAAVLTESIKIENFITLDDIQQSSVYISINDSNSMSFNEDLKPSEICINLSLSGITLNVDYIKSLTIHEKEIYDHLVFAKKYTMGQKLFIDDLSSYTSQQINTFKLFLIWALDSAKSVINDINDQFSDFFILNFFPKIRTLDEKSLNNPEELIKWIKNLYKEGEGYDVIFYNDFIPLSELNFDMSSFANGKQPGVVNFKEKMSLEMWIGYSLYSNLIKWIKEFNLLQGLIIKKGLNSKSSDKIAFNFVDIPNIDIINKSYVEFITRTTMLEELFLSKRIFSVKDVESFQFVKEIITPDDVYKTYCGYLMVKSEQYVISLNDSIKPSEDFKQAVEKALESINPFTDLQKVFDEYGQLFPTRIVLGKLYRNTLREFCISENANKKEDLGANPFETLKPYLEDTNTTLFLTGKYDICVKANTLSNLSNYTNDRLEIVELDNLVSTHRLLEIEQQNKIDNLMNMKDDLKIIMAGIDDLRDLHFAKDGCYKDIDTKVRFNEFNGVNFYIFGSIISKDNTKVEDVFIQFLINRHDGFSALIIPLSETSAYIKECYILWMIVGIPSKLNVFSPRNRELHFNFIIEEDVKFRFDDDDSYYPIKTSHQLKKGDFVFVNAYIPIGYDVKFVKWSKNTIYIKVFKDYVVSEDFPIHDDDDGIRDVRICVFPSDYKVLKFDNRNEECCLDLIGHTLTDENFIREDEQQEGCDLFN